MLVQTKAPQMKMYWPFSLLMASVKFFIFFLLIMEYIIHHQLASWVIRDEKKRLKYFTRSISLHARFVLKLFNIKVRAPRGYTENVQQRLIVSNHLSYLDVLMLLAYYPSLFITSVEIRDTFLLGRLTRLAGCFFVERRKVRRNADTIKQELESMKDTLNSGLNIFLFPEGTSSNGEGVLPFKNTFFQISLDCQVPVMPICLKYVEINGEKFNRNNADLVCWYGDMTFPDHLFKVCLQKKIIVEVTELPLIDPATCESRFAMADLAYKRIYETYSKH